MFKIKFEFLIPCSFLVTGMLSYVKLYSQVGEVRRVILGKKLTIVPKDKRWFILANIPLKIQVSTGTLESGTFCNAMFLSNPKILMNIKKGDYYRSESFGIIFKDLRKIPYTNEITYEINPIAFVDKKFSFNDLKNHSPHELGKLRIDFFPGDTLYTGNCIETIELSEISMSRKEIQDLENIKSKKEEEVRKHKIADYEKNKQLDLQYQKMKDEEFKDKILNKKSDGFFKAKDLKNVSELEITIDSNLLASIYKYIKNNKELLESNLKLKDDHYSDKSVFRIYSISFYIYINREGRPYKFEIPLLEKGEFSNERIDTLITSNLAGIVNY